MKHRFKTSLVSGGLFLSCLISGMAFFWGCTPKKTQETTPATTVVSVLAADPNYSVLVAAIKRAGLESALSTYVPFTVLAPNNAAFQAAGIAEAQINSLPVADLTTLLTYHILSGRRDASSFKSDTNSSQVFTSTGAKNLYISSRGGVFFNTPANAVAGATQPSTNGLIVPINRILMPPTRSLVDEILNNPDFSLLKAAILREGRDTLTKVQASDSIAGFTRVKVGDTVKVKKAETIAEVLKGNNFTILAPNNAAFTAAGLGTEVAINAANMLFLRSVLKYHVVEAKRVFISPDVVNSDPKKPLKTLITATLKPGVIVGKLDVSTAGGPKLIDDNGGVSNIVKVDIITTNGVIHSIDQVLIPRFK
jgi:uncharacterized surface protein with fasciclin (FAS1) repeats